MEKLDQNYLNNLVTKAKSGNSNAFAELFAAAYSRHFRYLSIMLKDKEKTEEALKQLYIRLLHSLARLNKPVLFMPWTCRMCFRYCSSLPGAGDPDRIITTPAGHYGISQLVSLPLTESQIMIMRYDQGLTVKEIGQILNFDKSVVKRGVKSGIRHLQKNASEQQPENIRIHEPGGSKARPAEIHPDAVSAPKILEEVFEAGDTEPNTVPLEALSAYVVYRRERFSLQRGILVAAIIVFLLLPLLFFLPKYEVNAVDRGERGLPVYTITVKSLLPVGKVKAKIRNHELPVYEVDAYCYTVEPTRNGELTVDVELINRQSVQQVYEVKEVDSNGPTLEGSNIGTETVLLKVQDAGIGVDYREIFAVSESGKIYHPIYVDEEKGEVEFSYPDETWDVYIPDHIGNMLHLNLTFQ